MNKINVDLKKLPYVLFLMICGVGLHFIYLPAAICCMMLLALVGITDILPVAEENVSESALGDLSRNMSAINYGDEIQAFLKKDTRE